MDYKAHLDSVFETPELSEEFFRLLIKQLNEVTFNGKAKIERVSCHSSIALKVKEHKGFLTTMPSSSYWLSISKTVAAYPD